MGRTCTWTLPGKCPTVYKDFFMHLCAPSMPQFPCLSSPLKGRDLRCRNRDPAGGDCPAAQAAAAFRGAPEHTGRCLAGQQVCGQVQTASELHRSCPVGQPTCTKCRLSGLDPLLGLDELSAGKAHLEPLKAGGGNPDQGPPTHPMNREVHPRHPETTSHGSLPCQWAWEQDADFQEGPASPFWIQSQA